MKTVGEILKQTREEKGISLGEVEKLTKIRIKYLEAIENNDFSKISQATTTQGFIRNYASILDLNPQTILAIFRRDFVENEKGQIIPRGMMASLDKPKFSWNPTKTIFLGLMTFLVVFLGFWFIQYLNYLSSPKIEIAFPPEGEIFNRKEIEILGKTDKDASLYINGEIVNLNPKGEFRKKIILKEGENELVFEAVSRQGKKTKLTRTINFLH